MKPAPAFGRSSSPAPGCTPATVRRAPVTMAFVSCISPATPTGSRPQVRGTYETVDRVGVAPRLY
eukprot:15482099-Alexandrium_andersonii.AAC.1